MAQERVEQRLCGLVRITLKKAYTDGRIAINPLSPGLAAHAAK